MSNIFSNPKYLEIVGRSLFPDQEVKPITVNCNGKTIRTLQAGAKTVLDWPFMDFFEAESLDEKSIESVAYIPRVHKETVSVKDWQERRPQMTPSPYINWSNFSSWTEFSERCRKINSRAFSKRSPAKKRKINDNIGEYKFIPTVDGNEAKKMLEMLFDWKSAQYKRSGYLDVFHLEKNRSMFLNLLDQDFFHLSALKAGEKTLALHAGFLYEGRFYYLLPAYDTDYTKYSAGILLTEEMIHSSYERGDIEFDFLLGEEEYKFYYATHVRLIDQVGLLFWRDKVWSPIRSFTIRPLRKITILYKFLQWLKRTVKQNGWM